MRGRYIGLEGVEGAGKTTLARLLAESIGRSVTIVREPGGTILGEDIRRLLLHSGEVSSWAEVALFAAARAQLVAEVVRPALARGDWVISDRTYVSSLAYQGGGRGLGVDAVRAVNELVLDGTIPDLVIIVDVDPRIGLGRQVEADRIGANGSDFLVEVARTYRSLVDGQRIVAVDGDGTAGEVCERILAVVQARWTL